ncbi:MAG TPA: c-type cytochrome biogenesis protein CcmI [Marinobacterium sp.]|nr:c-type cytochrome biogenesis protein CcmI [Marinobacterium sp.]
MMTLWIGIAALTLLALLFIFLPILRHRANTAANALSEARQQDNLAVFKDRLSELEQELLSGSMVQSEFDALKVELEKNLLIDLAEQGQALKQTNVSKGQLVTVVLIALILPAASLGLYMKLGSSAEVEMTLNLSEDPFEGREPTLEEAIAQLELELQRNPENPEGWYILSSTYMGQGRYQEAMDGYRQVLGLLRPEDVQYATVMGQLSQAMFFAAGGMSDQVREQVMATLEVEPLEITALGLLGADAFEKEDFRAAIAFWQQALLNADADTASSIQGGIERAREELIALGEDVSDIEVPAIARIQVNLSVLPGLTEGLPAETPVFVVARALDGGMPAAAVRLTLADLPISLDLTDANAMAPTNRLSSHEQVSVSARISKSGNVTPQVGDIVAEIAPVPTQGLESALELVVSEVVK